MPWKKQADTRTFTTQLPKDPQQSQLGGAELLLPGGLYFTARIGKRH